MRTILFYPGNMAHAQQAGRALFEAGALQAFVTAFAYLPDGRLARLLATLPGGAKVAEQLSRRAIDELPAHLVHTHPAWEVLRTAASKVGGPTITDMIWDALSHRLDALVARRYVPCAQAIQGFEYTVHDAFERAREMGVARILHVPSLDNEQFNEIQKRETAKWPELATRHSRHMQATFPRRQERRRKEIALADVVVANSTLTARSHIAAGADPGKVFVVPLAAPRPLASDQLPPAPPGRPLRVLWAGPFSIRKGAHYLLEAWRRLRPNGCAVLDVYGAIEVPRLAEALPDGIIMHGSVPKEELSKAYRAADVLLFPTLSDGFGMVVTEAMAHGLPVITTDQAGAADLVTPDNGLIIPAADADAIADAILWCLDNRIRLQEMRVHALESASRRQWSHFRSDLIEALGKGLRQAGYCPQFQSLA
jgi:glycosyltransferase involved in cell wall biosynthesis